MLQNLKFLTKIGYFYKILHRIFIYATNVAYRKIQFMYFSHPSRNFLFILIGNFSIRKKNKEGVMQANNNPPSETKFTIVTTLLLFIIPLLSFIAFTVTPDDNRVINPFFVLLIFSFILFSISVAFTGLYSRLYTSKTDDIAILCLATPFIPSFFFVSLLILAAFVLNEKSVIC